MVPEKATPSPPEPDLPLASDTAEAQEDQTSSPETPAVPEQTETPDFPTLSDIEKIVEDKLAEWENRQTEEQKIAKMTAAEKAAYEKETQENDYRKRLSELTKKELRIEAHRILTEKGLPMELLEVLRYSDAGSCNASIAAVEKAFRLSVEKGINDRLRGTAPKASSGSKATITVDQIKGMSQAEIMRNYKEIEKALAHTN